MAPEPGRCGHVQLLLGAYVLGGLSPADEADVQAHLAQCAQCQAEYEELACVPSWLDLLKSEDADAGPGQPEG
jgi:predicted anti-sigma-YlaC factor YlaD